MDEKRDLRDEGGMNYSPYISQHRVHFGCEQTVGAIIHSVLVP